MAEIALKPLPPPPHFIPKSINFREPLGDEKILSMQRTISRYDYCLQARSTLQEFHDKWTSIEHKNLIYDSKLFTKIYKVFNKQNPNEYCLVKTYEFPNDYYTNEKREHNAAIITETYYFMYHTNLLSYEQIYYDKNRQQLLITMEPLKISLKDFVKLKHKQNGGITEYECKFIISDLLNNLWTLHKTGNIYCDLKPINIMLRYSQKDKKRNGWKIIDFDNRFYMHLNKFKKTGAIQGTIEWLPPEIIPSNSTFCTDMNYFCYGMDIWSMGLIILFILFGKQPYQLTNEEEIKYEKYSLHKKSTQWYGQKLLKGAAWFCMNSDRNPGDLWLRNYLISLYFEDKISKDLLDLLHNYMLIFDPRKRAHCDKIWKHSWFDEIREKI
eukprot:111157_1